MSQITRCPSCGTSFKVVADQLRISEGWVRCGQCKEVFDAAAHRVVIEPAQLLPEMRFDGQRSIGAGTGPAVAPVKVWGSARSTPPPPAPSLPPAEDAGGTTPPPAGASGMAPPAPLPEAAAAPGGMPPPRSVDFPPAAPVPAFLAAPAPASVAGAPAEVAVPGWTLEPASPFGWQTRAPAVPSGGDALPPTSAPAASEGSHAGPAALVEPAGPDSGGYELPFAQLRDSEWPEDLELEGTPPPETERPLPVLSEVPGRLIAPSADAGPEAEGRFPDPALPGAMPRAAPQRRPPAARAPAVPVADGDGHGHGGADAGLLDEPGFVRSARRQAFWRRGAVRAALAVCLLLLGALLLAQVAVHERDVLAARHPALRGPLEALCIPWQCRLAAPRQIAAVVIDSSSFTRSRPDAYQLAVTLRNNADMAVAMPAMELTLTNAQEQPLLRKVLQAGDIAAPQVLPARGEWSGALSLNVAEVGSRVAGYRLLAFYP